MNHRPADRLLHGLLAARRRSLDAAPPAADTGAVLAAVRRAAAAEHDHPYLDLAAERWFWPAMGWLAAATLALCLGLTLGASPDAALIAFDETTAAVVSLVGL